MLHYLRMARFAMLVLIALACGRQDPADRAVHPDLLALHTVRQEFQDLAEAWPDSLKSDEALLQGRHLEGKPDSLLEACLRLDPDFLARSIELYGAAYRYALARFPDEPLPDKATPEAFRKSFRFFLRCHFRRQRQQPILALREIDSALVHAPRQPAYWAAKADALIALHQDEKALSALQEEIRFRRNPALALEKMSACQLQLGDTSAALETLGRLVKTLSANLTEDSSASENPELGQKLGAFHALRGHLLWEKGRQAEARIQLTQAARWGDTSGNAFLRFPVKNASSMRAVRPVGEK